MPLSLDALRRKSVLVLTAMATSPTEAQQGDAAVVLAGFYFHGHGTIRKDQTQAVRFAEIALQKDQRAYADSDYINLIAIFEANMIRGKVELAKAAQREHIKAHAATDKISNPNTPSHIGVPAARSALVAATPTTKTHEQLQAELDALRVVDKLRSKVLDKDVERNKAGFAELIAIASNPFDAQQGDAAVVLAGFYFHGQGAVQAKDPKQALKFAKIATDKDRGEYSAHDYFNLALIFREDSSYELATRFFVQLLLVTIEENKGKVFELKGSSKDAIEMLLDFLVTHGRTNPELAGKILAGLNFIANNVVRVTRRDGAFILETLTGSARTVHDDYCDSGYVFIELLKEDKTEADFKRYQDICDSLGVIRLLKIHDHYTAPARPLVGAQMAEYDRVWIIKRKLQLESLKKRSELNLISLTLAPKFNTAGQLLTETLLTDRINILKHECSGHGIVIVPPKINSDRLDDAPTDESDDEKSSAVSTSSKASTISKASTVVSKSSTGSRSSIVSRSSTSSARSSYEYKGAGSTSVTGDKPLTFREKRRLYQQTTAATARPVPTSPVTTTEVTPAELQTAKAAVRAEVAELITRQMMLVTGDIDVPQLLQLQSKIDKALEFSSRALDQAAQAERRVSEALQEMHKLEGRVVEQEQNAIAVVRRVNELGRASAFLKAKIDSKSEYDTIYEALSIKHKPAAGFLSKFASAIEQEKIASDMAVGGRFVFNYGRKGLVLDIIVALTGLIPVPAASIGGGLSKAFLSTVEDKRIKSKAKKILTCTNGTIDGAKKLATAIAQAILKYNGHLISCCQDEETITSIVKTCTKSAIKFITKYKGSKKIYAEDIAFAVLSGYGMKKVKTNIRDYIIAFDESGQLLDSRKDPATEMERDWLSDVLKEYAEIMGEVAEFAPLALPATPSARQVTVAALPVPPSPAAVRAPRLTAFEATRHRDAAARASRTAAPPDTAARGGSFLRSVIS